MKSYTKNQPFGDIAPSVMANTFNLTLNKEAADHSFELRTVAPWTPWMGNWWRYMKPELNGPKRKKKKKKKIGGDT